MILVYSTILFFYLVLIILTLSRQYNKTIAKNCHNGIFRQVAELLYSCRTCRNGSFEENCGNQPFPFSSKQVMDDLKYLHPAEAIYIQKKKFYINKLSKVLFIGFLGCFSGLCIAISSEVGNNLQEGHVIERNQYGDGDQAVTLIASVGPEEKKEKLDIIVHQKKYTMQEFLDEADQLAEELFYKMLENNESNTCIQHDLLITQSTKTVPFEIEWSFSDETVISLDGKLNENYIPQQGIEIDCILIICLESYTHTYTKKLFILPPETSTYVEHNQTGLLEIIQNEELIQEEEPDFTLPQVISGNRIQWTYQKSKSEVGIFCFTLAVMIGFYIYTDYQLHEKANQRQKELIRLYPEMISTLCLYIGAGITMRESIRRIAESKENNDPLTEELLYTCREMEDGVSELMAYVNLGKRCRHRYYLRFSSLLTQNLRRGNKNILSLLKTESDSVFEERKNNARKLGERAGTKLLLPMILMLVVVMIVIMVPAFMMF